MGSTDPAGALAGTAANVAPPSEAAPRAGADHDRIAVQLLALLRAAGYPDRLDPGTAGDAPDDPATPVAEGSAPTELPTQASTEAPTAPTLPAPGPDRLGQLSALAAAFLGEDRLRVDPGVAPGASEGRVGAGPEAAGPEAAGPEAAPIPAAPTPSAVDIATACLLWAAAVDGVAPELDDTTAQRCAAIALAPTATSVLAAALRTSSGEPTDDPTDVAGAAAMAVAVLTATDRLHTGAARIDEPHVDAAEGAVGADAAEGAVGADAAGDVALLLPMLQRCLVRGSLSAVEEAAAWQALHSPAPACRHAAAAAIELQARRRAEASAHDTQAAEQRIGPGLAPERTSRTLSRIDTRLDVDVVHLRLLIESDTALQARLGSWLPPPGLGAVAPWLGPAPGEDWTDVQLLQATCGTVGIALVTVDGGGEGPPSGFVERLVAAVPGLRSAHPRPCAIAAGPRRHDGLRLTVARTLPTRPIDHVSDRTEDGGKLDVENHQAEATTNHRAQRVDIEVYGAGRLVVSWQPAAASQAPSFGSTANQAPSGGAAGVCEPAALAGLELLRSHLAWRWSLGHRALTDTMLPSHWQVAAYRHLRPTPPQLLVRITDLPTQGDVRLHPVAAAVLRVLTPGTARTYHPVSPAIRTVEVPHGTRVLRGSIHLDAGAGPASTTTLAGALGVVADLQDLPRLPAARTHDRSGTDRHPQIPQPSDAGVDDRG